jgi:hypothetical protein
VGTALGTLPSNVAGELTGFDDAMRRGVRILDPIVAVGARPDAGDELRGVINLMAGAHGEWVRIHPFANGNGTTARLWANWVALRYGLPPFVRLKPRPEGFAYPAAAAASMKAKNHEPTAVLFMDMLNERLRKGPGR